MRRPSDDLFRLVKSMTGSEKGYFQKMSVKSSDKNINKYIKLFNLIDSQTQNKNYEESMIRQGFKNDSFVNNLHVAKGHLYKLILKSLMQYHSQNSISININELFIGLGFGLGTTVHCCDIIQSMLYYETKRFENLISEKDAIIHFIANDKILSIEGRNKFRKYVKYLDELVKLNTKEQRDIDFAVTKTKEKLISENGILEKAWLLEKLNEMSRKPNRENSSIL